MVTFEELNALEDPEELAAKLRRLENQPDAMSPRHRGFFNGKAVALSALNLEYFSENMQVSGGWIPDVRPLDLPGRKEWLRGYFEGIKMVVNSGRDYVLSDETSLPVSALEKVLDLHQMQEAPVRSYNSSSCPAHGTPVVVDFALFEEIKACPDCTYTEYYVCSHCECPHDEWPCPTVRLIQETLLG